jgi:2,4-dienoyl-CoA reductase-like NADH-dependent reductase (Old Yellow Enzyme family)/thioredoxin reductase
MKLIRSLMGRRQFLMAAGAASAAGIGVKKLGAFMGQNQPETAMAADAAGSEGIFSDRYRHLLSPIRLGNVLVKNRLMQSDSYPFFMQGPELFPSEQGISWYADVARNGCGIVMVFKGDDPPPEGESKEVSKTHGWIPVWDKDDVKVQSYFAQLTDAVHFHRSRAAVTISPDFDRQYSISAVAAPGPFMGRGGPEPKEIPAELIQEAISGVARQARFYQGLGFDMVHFHMSYRRSLLANALSPVMNVRKDKYGGSLENRARLHLEMFEAVKKACGPDFLVGCHLSGKEMGEGGYTTEDLAETAKIWEDALDIMVVRGETDNISHASPYTFNDKYNPILEYARLVKAGGTKLAVVPNGGFQDLDQNEEYIASGMVDMVSMARAWWADSRYGQKAYEGRGEDVVPCIRCNNCHGKVTNVEGPPISFCSVNPEYGHAHRMNRMIDPPATSRKVAVIGGGPAGMKAAIVAAERGHRVTLYEKNDFLGGQLKHSDLVSFKWSIRIFKDYLIRQVEKAGIEVRLKTRATPEMIKKKGYDVVLAALGAAPILPDLPGGKGNILAPVFVHGNKALGKDIVVVGGEQIATETGLHLAETGHRVTLLTEDSKLAPDANFVHLSRERWDMEKFKAFSFVTGAVVKNISKKSVTYADARGDEKSIPADTVVVYAGRRPRLDEALGFHGAAGRFFVIGDCSMDGNLVRISDGNVHTSQRTAFAAASKI